MKKTLALVLALAMVFSTITVAFAEGTIGADAQICSDLGMLKGSTGTVDAAYVATAPTRIQAAVMFLRLKGLEAEATAFTGEANFADAAKAAWAKPIMAYLKANPQLGWAGDGTNFNPTNTVTAKEYYKVLLETLGYKQNTAEVVGDFTWDNVIEFAAGKGLTKVAAVTNYTVNDLAIATVEALKLNVKDGSKTLVASLIEAGKVDKAKAVTAGLYTEAAAVDMKAVKSVANNVLEVEFTAEVAKAYAENTATYKVVEKGTTTAIEVKAATLDTATKALVEVAALGAGKSYTLTVGTISKNFAGVAKDTVAPKLDTVKCIDTNRVEITFDKVMDAVTARDIANYKLNKNATVKAAELDSDRKVVTLTTEGVSNGYQYTLSIENVKSSDLVAIKAVSKTFTGKTDTTAPKIKEFKVVNNRLLKLTFAETNNEHGINKASAETLANWSINDLAIESIKAIDNEDDDYGYYEIVEITTATQTAGKAYTLTINNLVDGSTSANALTKAIEKDFKGAYADTKAPTVKFNPTSATHTSVEIVFADTNALGVASATDVNNYEITYRDGSSTETLAITKAEIKDTDDMYVDDGRTVVLTTDEQDDKYTYTLVIKGVADEFDNEIEPVSGTTYKKYSFKGKDEDITPPYVKGVSSTDNKTVKVVFDDKIDKATATDPTNYSINENIGVAKKASLSSTDSKTVTLTTPEQVVGKLYTITINGLKDLSGNELANVKVSFVSARTSNDTVAPEVAYIESMYKDEIRVHFDEAIKSATGNVTGIQLTVAGITFSGVGSLLDDETTVVMKANNAMTASKYVVTGITNVKDLSGNAYVAPTTAHEFWGTAEANEGPTVSSWEQTDVNTIRVVFSEPVSFGAGVTYDVPNDDYDVNGAQVTEPAKDANDKAFPVVNWTAAIDPDGDETNEGYSTIDFVADKVLPIVNSDAPIKFNFTALATDYVGTGAVDDDDVAPDFSKTTSVTTYIEDEEDPTIADVVAADTKKITVIFSEDVLSAHVGSYKVSYDDDGVTKYVALGAPARDASNYSKVNIPVTTGALDSDFVYTLVPLTGAWDLSENTLDTKDVSIDFPGTEIIAQNYLRGVKVIDATTIEVSMSAAITTVQAIYELDADGNAITATNLKGVVSATDSSKVKNVAVNRAVLDGTYYHAIVDGITYKFEGIVEDSGVSVDSNGLVRFSGMDVETPYTQTVSVIIAGTPYATTVGATGFTINAAPALVVGTTEAYVTVTRTSDGVVLYGAKVKVVAPN